MNITATWLPDLYGYRLQATGGVGAPMWYRSAYWADGRTSSASIGTGNPYTDLEVPLDGATVAYTAVDGASVVESAPLHPVSAMPVLGMSRRTDLAAAEVVIESLREQTVAGRSIFYDVLDRNEPYIQALKPIERTGRMTLRVAHDGGPFPGTALGRLRRMLRTGEPMTLRTTCNDRVEDLNFVFNSWMEQQIGDNNEHGPDRKLVIDWRAVDPMWGWDVEVSPRVWGLVPKEFATWDAVVANVSTWDGLVAGET